MDHGGHSLVARGLYALQLEPWLNAFPDTIHVFTLEDLQGPNMNEKTMAYIYKCVGLPPHPMDNREVQTFDGSVFCIVIVF